ncbi:CHAT domain-containing protein [Egbenema bharatensis]|uniref:CHAT domain-containing protein n=1 Tax=Egbenema bharatensis TaxID=3463334 RepID=UPI003A8C7535
MSNLKKILILAANPKNTQKLRLDEEVREIQEELRRARHREQFEVISCWAVRPEDLRRALLDYEPQIVHFSGHGEGDDGLALENELGQIQLVNTESLARLFKLFTDQIECVVLNACFSKIQATTIHQHISCVIGMSQAIGDKAAVKFSSGFYGALGAGRTYQAAYEFGCSAIDLENIPEYMTPVLLHREQAKDSLELSAQQELINRDSNKDLEIVDAYVIDDRDELKAFWQTWLKTPFWRILFKSSEGKEEELSRFPLIDIKLRNTSAQSVFLKEITVNASRTQAIPWTVSFMMIPPTCAYHILLGKNWRDDKEENVVKISQLVKPNDVDRFIVIVGSQDHLEYAEYNAELTLYYNKDSCMNVGAFPIKMHIPYAFNRKKLDQVNSLIDTKD